MVDVPAGAAVVGTDPATGATYTQTPAQAASVAAPANPTAPGSVATTTPATDPAKATTDPTKTGTDADPASTAPFDPAKATVPEGFTVDAPTMEKFAAIAKEAGLPQAVAQKLIDLQAQFVKDHSTSTQKSFTDLQDKWQGEVKADKEIGGANLDRTVQTIGKALTEYGAPGIKEALDSTGAGNNPAIVRTMYNMAKALTEGRPQAAASAPSTDTRSMAERMYPSMAKPAAGVGT